LRREYEHGGDQEDAGLRTQFTGDSSIMSYSCIASNGESSPIEFDLDTLASRTIVPKSTIHSGDRHADLDEGEAYHDPLPQLLWATQGPVDCSSGLSRGLG
jgi:hypothetical protein